MNENDTDTTNHEEEESRSSTQANSTEEERNQEMTQSPVESEYPQTERQSNTNSDEEQATAEEEKPPAPDWLIENIAELSKNARSLYLLYLGFLAYSATTVVGTSDRQILLGESVRLPIVGVDVSLSGFFTMAPLMAIGTFVYLQLYLQELKSLKNTLRADYQPVDSGRLYPWMLNIIDQPQPGLIGWFQRIAVKGVLWWILPVVLFLFAVWYLRAQDSSLSGCFVVLMPAFGFTAICYFRHMYEARGFPLGWGTRVILALGIGIQGLLLWIFVQVNFVGQPIGPPGGIDAVDVSSQSLVTVRQHAPYWANLRGRSLRGANFRGSVLSNSDLRASHMEEAYLVEANLTDADLRRARLNSARLRDTRLTGADLREAYLQDANLAGTHLDSADLRYANLQNAELFGSDLRGSNLRQIHAHGAFFESIDMRSTYLSGARLDSTIFFGGNLKGAVVAELYPNVKSGSVHVVHFQGAEFYPGILDEGSPKVVIDSLLCETTLPHQNNLSPCTHNPKMVDAIVKEMCKSKTLEGVAVDSLIGKGIKENCPNLLEGAYRDKTN